MEGLAESVMEAVGHLEGLLTIVRNVVKGQGHIQRHCGGPSTPCRPLSCPNYCRDGMGISAGML